MTELCTDCPHPSGDHVLVAGPTIGIVVCPEPECPCDIDPPAHMHLRRPTQSFVEMVRKAVQQGVRLA